MFAFGVFVIVWLLSGFLASSLLYAIADMKNVSDDLESKTFSIAYGLVGGVNSLVIVVVYLLWTKQGFVVKSPYENFSETWEYFKKM